MDLSSIKWEVEDYSLIHQYNLNFTQDLATPLFQSGDSYNMLNNGFKNNIETSLSFDHFLSFDRKTSGYNFDCIVKPKDKLQMRVSTFSSVPLISDHENPKPTLNHEGSNRNFSLARAPTQAQDHVMAERRRREKLSERFVALSALVPNLTKMDKASILGDAMKYMEKLQQRVKVLEEQTKKITMESKVMVNKSRVSFDEDASSSGENYDEEVSEIEARVSDKDVLIRIHCKNKHKGLVAKMISEVEGFHLSVENIDLFPFGDFDLHVTIVAQMDDEFIMTVKDLVKKLRLALLKFM